jgi:hypothetical protein
MLRRRWEKPPTKYQLEHVSRAELIRLLEAALALGAGPFGRELVTPSMLTLWFCQTSEGFSLLYEYLSEAIPPWPIAIGRVVSEVDGMEAAQRCLRPYSDSPIRFYILKNHAYWRNASPLDIMDELCRNDTLYPSGRIR